MDVGTARTNEGTRRREVTELGSTKILNWANQRSGMSGHCLNSPHGSSRSSD